MDDDDEDVPFRQRPTTISWSVASQQDVVGEMLSANDLLLKSSRHRVDAIVRSSRLLLGEALLAAGAPPEMLRDGRVSTTPVDDARKVSSACQPGTRALSAGSKGHLARLQSALEYVALRASSLSLNVNSSMSGYRGHPVAGQEAAPDRR